MLLDERRAWHLGSAHRQIRLRLISMIGPPKQGRSTRRIATTVAMGDNAARPAPDHLGRGLDRDPQPCLVTNDVDDVEPLQLHEPVTATAAVGIWTQHA